ncbi:MAG: thiol-disulfide oxidoreductase [Flavobacterium sp.]|nr:MAG: thiol-disulfide oxidoreductase [Flavobacterium sp.]
MKKNHKIILFDGVCNLCNASVNFVIKRDKNDVFRFAALQSEIGNKYISELNINPLDTDSIILIDEDKCYVKSTAALHITKSMSGAYPLLFGFIIVPKFIRNWVYDYVAKNRYKWYGKKESCMIPSEELKRKFL